MINPFVHGKKPDQSQLQEHLEDLNKTLTFLQKHILGDKEYLFGDDITVGDLFAVSEVSEMPFLSFLLQFFSLLL